MLQVASPVAKNRFNVDASSNIDIMTIMLFSIIYLILTKVVYLIQDIRFINSTWSYN